MSDQEPQREANTTTFAARLKKLLVLGIENAWDTLGRLPGRIEKHWIRIPATVALLSFFCFGWCGSRPETWDFIKEPKLSQDGAANLFKLGFLMVAAVVFARIHRRLRHEDRREQRRSDEVTKLNSWLEADHLNHKERESLVKLRNECLIGTAYDDDGRF